MQLIKPDVNFEFVGRRKLAIGFSVILILIGLISLVVKGGPNYGIDFVGGSLVQIKFQQTTNASDIKDALKDLGLGNMSVQQFGDDANEFLVRAQAVSSELKGLGHRVEQALEASYGAGKAEVRRVEMVGPQVGKDLREKGFKAVLFAMVAILIYITLRFEFRFAVGAVLALVHDVMITLGAFSVFNKEIDLPIIAAFLAIIGYSLNDTIIVYDRIRENMGRYHKEPFPVIVNRSINETLSRTILTSGTTLLVVAALFIFGGGVIHNFAFALLVGVLIGTYSSIFVASPLLIFWQDYKNAKQGKAAAKGNA
ncbi:protein translocase subunit SecF [Geothermobacter hydrogeniphilus]|uniref:Protein-export membrane protein SecF n=1 Tax=Geothermobacter hydrogeniphilus TaxID=1969733 RepID=A0A1X0Y8R6_9BACT|nr:protein translocase subunit SecF [Geothermobacter hydrogeniphilus]ORJ61516.1 protein translocase subunit SecF [Geothermobacter hydrogeniphilus]